MLPKRPLQPGKRAGRTLSSGPESGLQDDPVCCPPPIRPVIGHVSDSSRRSDLPCLSPGSKSSCDVPDGGDNQRHRAGRDGSFLPPPHTHTHTHTHVAISQQSRAPGGFPKVSSSRLSFSGRRSLHFHHRTVRKEETVLSHLSPLLRSSVPDI